jgi:hypothetical protein
MSMRQRSSEEERSALHVRLRTVILFFLFRRLDECRSGPARRPVGFLFLWLVFSCERLSFKVGGAPRIRGRVASRRMSKSRAVRLQVDQQSMRGVDMVATPRSSLCLCYGQGAGDAPDAVSVERALQPLALQASTFHK